MSSSPAAAPSPITGTPAAAPPLGDPSVSLVPFGRRAKGASGQTLLPFSPKPPAAAPSTAAPPAGRGASPGRGLPPPPRPPDAPPPPSPDAAAKPPAVPKPSPSPPGAGRGPATAAGQLHSRLGAGLPPPPKKSWRVSARRRLVGWSRSVPMSSLPIRIGTRRRAKKNSRCARVGLFRRRVHEHDRRGILSEKASENQPQW